MITTNFNASSTVGHVFVIFDEEGDRITCDPVPELEELVGRTVIAGDFASYSDYDGDFDSVSGVVDFAFYSTGRVVFNYDLDGVDSDCGDGPDSETDKSCAIVIHEGTCDDDDDVGDHYWDD
jgi:hypothetical protein